MSENIENTPPAGEEVQATSSDPAPQTPVTPPAPEPAPPVDLAREAGEVAAKQPRSLDELGLDADTRTKVDSYISRQVNDARDKWDQRKQKEIEDGKFMTREEVSSLLNKQAEEVSAREQAKDSFVRNLGKLGIQVGSEEYDKVSSYYTDAAEKGLVNPNILSDADGLKMLVQLSGALPEPSVDVSGPSQGLPKSHPDGLQHGDGSIQLGAQLAEGQEVPVGMRIEKAMIEAMRDSN